MNTDVNAKNARRAWIFAWVGWTAVILLMFAFDRPIL
jgi:hypothetical protein